jgi:hypothetical protein
MDIRQAEARPAMPQMQERTFSRPPPINIGTPSITIQRIVPDLGPPPLLDLGPINPARIL